MKEENKEMTSEQKARVESWRDKINECKEQFESAEWRRYDFPDWFHYIFLSETRCCIEALRSFDQKGWLNEERQKDLKFLEDGYGLWMILSKISEDAGKGKYNMEAQREFLRPISEGVDEVLKMGLFIETI